MPSKEYMRARREVVERRRPIILDDDGDLVYDPRVEAGPDVFTHLRLADLLDTPVDSLAWCMMWGIAKGSDQTVRYWQNQQLGVPFHDNMPDPTPVVRNFCQQHDIEVFGSIRMNDCHDAFGLPSPRLLYPLKSEHPDYLLGDEGQRGGVEDGLVPAMWSGLNFALPEVIEDRLWWIEHTATTYDLDGVDLNFFRMPWVFKLGEEEDHIPVMTEFLRRARRIVDQVGEQRGRPMLLGVRVLDTVETNLKIGMDLEAWLIEGLVDRVLAGGGYASFCVPAEELIELGHRFDVPVYPCINCPGTFDLGADRGFESLRGAAANFLHAGGDGIYLWNYQYLNTPHIAYGQPFAQDYDCLADLADPTRLAGLDKVFSVNRRPLEQYARGSAFCPLPMPLFQSRGSVALRIGDDLEDASTALLQLDLENCVDGDEVTVQINDLTLICEEGDRVELPLFVNALEQGDNELKLEVTKRGEGATAPVTVHGVRILVRY